MALTQELEYVRFDTSVATSEAITINNGYYPSSLLLSQSFADSLSFQVSFDGTTWYVLHDPDADSAKVYYIEVDSSATRALTLDRNVFYPWRRVKVVTDITTSAGWDTLKMITEKKKTTLW